MLLVVVVVLLLARRNLDFASASLRRNLNLDLLNMKKERKRVEVSGEDGLLVTNMILVESKLSYHFGSTEGINSTLFQFSSVIIVN